MSKSQSFVYFWMFCAFASAKRLNQNAPLYNRYYDYGLRRDSHYRQRSATGWDRPSDCNNQQFYDPLTLKCTACSESANDGESKSQVFVSDSRRSRCECGPGTALFPGPYGQSDKVVEHCSACANQGNFFFLDFLKWHLQIHLYFYNIIFSKMLYK